MTKVYNEMFSKIIKIENTNFQALISFWNVWLNKRNVQIPSVTVDGLVFVIVGFPAGVIVCVLIKTEQIKF
jgi:hypothetical protein